MFFAVSRCAIVGLGLVPVRLIVDEEKSHVFVPRAQCQNKPQLVQMIPPTIYLCSNSGRSMGPTESGPHEKHTYQRNDKPISFLREQNESTPSEHQGGALSSCNAVLLQLVLLHTDF